MSQVPEHESQHEIFQKPAVYKAEETKAERTVKPRSDGTAAKREETGEI